MTGSELNEADQAAVDLYFDRAPHLRSQPLPQVGAQDSGVEALRVAALAQLISNLDHLESVEPPADLVAKTLARIATPAPSETTNPNLGIDTRPF